jgi:hypothetical protein
MYRDLMLEKRFNFKVVKGTGDNRLQNAIVFVDEYLKSIK